MTTDRMRGIQALEEQREKAVREMSSIAMAIANRAVGLDEGAWTDTPDQNLHAQYKKASEQFWRAHVIVRERREEWV